MDDLDPGSKKMSLQKILTHQQETYEEYLQRKV